MMKQLAIIIGSFFLLTGLPAQDLVPVEKGSEIKFTIKNFGLNVGGSFKGLKGKISFNPANPSSASINVGVDANTVNTGNDSRDNHLRKETYFNVAKYPGIGFLSTSITKVNQTGNFLVTGKITIKGITKTISFPFTATPGAGGYLFEGSFKLNRRDFGVGDKSLVLSDNLTVSLHVLTTKAN